MYLREMPQGIFLLYIMLQKKGGPLNACEPIICHIF